MTLFHKHPRFLALLAMLTLSLTSIQTSYAEDDTPLRDAREFTPRGGLPNFFRKLKSDQDVTVSYIGGSITAQSGWRVMSQNWLEEQYPKSTITGVNAAVAGTGSDLGVFRVENDALQAQPDLLFVEFAVNDQQASPTNITKSMEGIVRKTWKANPETDICFVYTMTGGNSKQLANGKMMRSSTVMEAVADHYGIPSIEMGYQAAQLQKEGKLIMKTSAPLPQGSDAKFNDSNALPTDAEGRIIFSKDGVHPYPETGHVLYTQALIRSLTQIQNITAKSPHTLGTPIRADNLENAQQVPVTSKYLSGNYTDLRKAGNTRFNKEMTQLHRLEPGASLSFEFIGTDVALYDLRGYDSAKVEITLDGQVSTNTRFDGYCSYQRLARIQVGNNLENTRHKVTIRVLDEKLEKRNILFKEKRSDYDKNPEKYAPHYWYVGTILIAGEMVE